MKLEVETAMSRHSNKVESGFDRILGFRLMAFVDPYWYGTMQRYVGDLLILSIGAVW